MNEKPAVAPSVLVAHFGDLLGSNAAEHAERLGPLLEPMEVEQGSVVCEHGRPTDSLFLVESGKLEVSIQGASATQTLARFGPGDWFGELGLIAPDTGLADVVATTPSRLFRLSHAGFQTLMDRHPPVARALLHRIDQVLVKRITSARGELHGQVDPQAGWFSRLVGAFFATRTARA